MAIIAIYDIGCHYQNEKRLIKEGMGEDINRKIKL